MAQREEKPLAGHRRRWQNNIKADLQEMIGGCGLDFTVEGASEVSFERSKASSKPQIH
jgi:hypothetical protein